MAETETISEIPFLFEFIFNDQYDDSVFSQYSQASDELKIEIQTTANNLKSILKLKPGIRSISSFSHFLNNAYKVTLINTSWKLQMPDNL